MCQNRRRENFEVFFEPLSPEINSRYSDPKNAQSPLYGGPWGSGDYCDQSRNKRRA